MAVKKRLTPSLPRGWKKMSQAARILVALKRSPTIAQKFRNEAAFIVKYPFQYNQGVWGEKVKKTLDTPCGTVACIAGGYALQSGCKLKGFDTFTKNGREIDPWSIPIGDLNYAFGGKRDGTWIGEPNLFGGLPSEVWPSPFKEMWMEVSDKTHFAQIAVARIEHFLRTGQ